jgi:hypothetical protein
MKKKLENSEWAKVAGKTTYLKVDWKDWKKERPVSGETVLVIVRLDKGYYPTYGTYYKETIVATSWQYVRFAAVMIPDIFEGTSYWKRLIAWGKAKQIKKPTKERERVRVSVFKDNIKLYAKAHRASRSAK